VVARVERHAPPGREPADQCELGRGALVLRLLRLATVRRSDQLVAVAEPGVGEGRVAVEPGLGPRREEPGRVTVQAERTSDRPRDLAARGVRVGLDLDRMRLTLGSADEETEPDRCGIEGRDRVERMPARGQTQT
jgi:hypothetical protein